MTNLSDTELMQRAINLAEHGKYSAKPNPHVGCVIVKDGQIVGEGYTQPPGQGHAEVMALAQAGEQARGATAYVTLEPCNHQGRTGPCSQALIQAGISKVVAAIEDPYPEVAGSGFEALKHAGIEVRVGLLADTVKQQLQGFLLRLERGYGRVRLKLACSLDGKIALANGESQWITGPNARRDVQRLRAEAGLVITGVGTVLEDDCQLNVREGDLPLDPNLAREATAHQPLRAVFDSTLETPASARILNGARTLFCAEPKTTRPDHINPENIVEVAALKTPAGLKNALLQLMAIAPANEILLECGPRLAGSWLNAGLVDELILYQAPVILGHNAQSLVHMDIATMTQRLNFGLIDTRRIGPDLKLTFKPTH